MIYVDDDAQPGGDGLTWTTAYASVQDALGDASQNPSVTEIHVAQGTYKPGTTCMDTLNRFANELLSVAIASTVTGLGR